MGDINILKTDLFARKQVFFHNLLLASTRQSILPLQLRDELQRFSVIQFLPLLRPFPSSAPAEADEKNWKRNTTNPQPEN